MDLNKKLEKYADLIVNIGLGLHAGDKLAIRMSEHSCRWLAWSRKRLMKRA